MHGSVAVVSNHLRCYSEQNLEKLAMRHGFKVECSFGLSLTGHLSPIDKNQGQIGVVMRNVQ